MFGKCLLYFVIVLRTLLVKFNLFSSFVTNLPFLSYINLVSILYSKFEKSRIIVKSIEVEEVEENYWRLSFFIVYDRRIILDELVKELNLLNSIINVDYLH